MSDAGAMRISVDDTQLVTILQKAPETVQRRVGQLVESAAVDIQAEMRIQANVGATGDLRRSIRYTYTPSQLKAEVGPNTEYAQDLEQGTKAHYVSAAPGSPLARWARLKGLNAYAVAAGIKKRGTKAHPYVVPTFNKMKPKVESDIATGVATLVGELNNGSV